MSLSAKIQGFTAVFVLVFMTSCFQKEASYDIVDGYVIPRYKNPNGFIMPINAMYQADDVRKKSMFELNARYFYLQGEYLSRKDDLEGALINLEKARELDENGAQIYHSLSSIYLRMGKSVEAEALLRKTIELEPENVQAILDLAQILKTGENFAEVRELFERASSLSPDSDEANLGLVILDIYKNKTKSAKQNLKKYLKKRPDSFLAHYYLATIDHKDGRVESAEKSYRKVLELNPAYSRAGVFLGQILSESGREEETIALFESLSRQPGSEQFMKQIAEYYEANGDEGKALEAYEKYIATGFDDPQALLKLSFLYVRSNEKDKAENNIRTLIKSRPAFSSAHYLLGVLLEDKKEYKEALDAFSKVGWDSSFGLEVLKAKSRIYTELKKFERGWFEFQQALTFAEKKPELPKEQILVSAINYLNKFQKFDLAKTWSYRALEEFPLSESIQYSRAFVYDESGESIKGAQQLEAFVKETKSKNPALLNFIGYVYAEKGVKLDKAESYIRKALKLKENDPFITDSLGWVLYKKKDYRAAETFLRKAHEAAPNEVVIMEHLADCLVKLGSLQEANELYVKAEEIGHTNADEQNNLKAKIAKIKDLLQAKCLVADACDVVRKQRTPSAQAK